MRNLFEEIPASLPAELAETLLSTPNIRIERIVSLGHTSHAGFWYDQELQEWVVLLTGAAKLQFEGEEPIELKPGDCVHIAAHRRHRVEWTTPYEPTIWLAMHFAG